MLKLPFLTLAAILLFLTGCTGDNDSESDISANQRTIQITIQVPEDTPTVYLTGNLPALGPWNPAALAMDGEGTERTASINAPANFDFEYKFTLGTWHREALSSEGAVLPNFHLFVTDNSDVNHKIDSFKKDPTFYMDDWASAGVLGRMVNWTDVESEFLSESRHVQIWLPPAYDEQPDKRFDVLYMHDGQNLFDPRLVGTGVDWGVDEAIVKGVGEGLFDPVIVVGVWNSSRRLQEYSPWHDASQYARFLTEELIPRINTEFRTETGPQNTFVMGASMGGLLSYYLVKEHPETFSACGCVSSHFPLSEAIASSIIGDAASDDTTPYILKDIAAGHTIPEGTRFFFDYGTEGLDADYGTPHEAVREWLLEQDLQAEEDFIIREYDGADHNEASWRARLEDQLVWMLGS